MDWHYYVESDISNTIRNSLLMSGFCMLIKNISYNYKCKVDINNKINRINFIFLKQYYLIESIKKNCWNYNNCFINMKTNNRIIFTCFILNISNLIINKLFVKDLNISSNKINYEYLYNNELDYNQTIIKHCIKGIVNSWYVFGKTIPIISCSLLGGLYGFFNCYIYKKLLISNLDILNN